MHCFLTENGVIHNSKRSFLSYSMKIPYLLHLVPHLFFSRGLRDSISYSVCPLVYWSVHRLVRHTFTFLALCERFWYHRSCPITCHCCCHVYGVRNCPCPPEYRSCPTPATYAALFLFLPTNAILGSDLNSTRRIISSLLPD